MGYIILPAKEIEELQNIDIRPGQVVMFGDSLSDGNITMKGLGGSLKDLTEIGGTEGTIRYNEEDDKIEIQRAGEWKDSDSAGGGSGGGFTISATDNQIPFVDSTNTAYEYSSGFTFNNKTLTIIGGNTNDILISTYTDGNNSGTDAQTFSVKSRGDLTGAINGKAWKLSRFSTYSVLFGSKSNHPLSIGAGTDIGGSNKTGGHMHINPNGNITIGDDTFESSSPANGYSKGARLYVKSDASGTNLHLASNTDVTLFKVLNDGTINIPSTSIKATEAVTLLAVDSNGNVVDGSSLAGSGGSGSNITYGNTNDIPYVNGNTDGFSYDTTNTFTYDGDGRLLVNHASADRESFSATNSDNDNAAILGTANGLQLFRGGVNNKEFKIDNTGTNVTIGTDGTSAQNIIFNAGAQGTAPVQLQSTDGLLKYVDGNQTAGHVLTSDAAGVATWQLPSSGNNSSNVIYGLSTQIPIVDSSNAGFRYSGAFIVSGDNNDASMQIKNSAGNWIGLKVLDYNNNYTNINSTGLVGTTDYSTAGSVKTPYLGWKISRLSNLGIFIGSTDGNKSLFLSTKDNNTNAARVFEMTSTGDVMLGKRHYDTDETASLAIFNDTSDGTSSVLKLLANTGSTTTTSYVDIIDFKNDGTINIPSTSIKSTDAATLLAVDANGNIVDGSSLAGSGGSGSGSNITYGDAGNIPFVNTAEDGFDYTDITTAAGFPGKLTFDSGTLTVRGLIPTDNGSYTDKKALTTLSIVKSHDINNVKQSLAVRGDGTVFIGESRIVNGSTISGNLYQNVLGIHEMSVAAISEMENQTYIHKLYVDSADNGRLMFKTDTGTTSLLNAWAAIKDTGSPVERTTLTGYNKSIIELRSSGSGGGDNDFGTSSQGNTLVAAQSAKIGTNGTNLTANTFSNSIIVSSGSASFATHGGTNNSVLVGDSSSIQSGKTNFVFGGSSHVYHTASGNDHNFIAGKGNYAHGFKNAIIGSNANLNPASLYVNNRFSNPVPDHIKYSMLIGHHLYAARDNQILIGNGYSAAYVPVPMVAITPNKSQTSNHTGSFAIYWPVDDTGNATDDFKAHNMVFGINAVRAEASNGIGGSPISQYSGQNIFQLIHGYDKSMLREPTGKINYTFSMWPISVTQENSNSWLGKTGLKMKTSGTVNGGNVTHDARYHFLGESAIFNGGIHAERHADKDISVIAIGRGDDLSTSSIQSKNINNEVTFDVRDDGVVMYKSVTFNNLPPATTATGGQMFLTAGGSETNVMVYSNGTSWISMSSGNPVILTGAA